MSGFNHNLELFEQAYTAAMLWANTYVETERGMESGDPGLDLEDVTLAVELQVRSDCATFLATPITLAPGAQSVYETLIEHGITFDQAGHDFALTRNHHGAGFWDRGYGEVGNLLTKVCDYSGEASWWVNDGKADTE